MLEKVGINMDRVELGKNDISTIERGIATLKGLITRRTITQGGGNWVEELQTATYSYNNTGHQHLGDEPPEDVETNDSLQFQLHAQAARDRDTQTTATQKETLKLLDAGTYRVEVNNKVKGFAKERSFKPKFQERIRQLAPEQNNSGRYVTDTRGEETLKSRIRQVPAGSTSITIQPNAIGGNTQRDPAKINATMALAKEILGK